MKLYLAQIPDEGLTRTLQIDLGTLERLREALGEQQGELRAELTIKNRDGNVEITGTLEVALLPPCQRCLEPVPLRIAEPIRVALVSERSYDDAPEDTNLGQGDLELSFYQGEELDLSHILEDEVMLLLPEPMVEEDDEGRCLVCGRDVDEIYTESRRDRADHPFAALKSLMKPD